jgi:hypothetical protein
LVRRTFEADWGIRGADRDRSAKGRDVNDKSSNKWFLYPGAESGGCAAFVLLWRSLLPKQFAVKLSANLRGRSVSIAPAKLSQQFPQQ